MSKIENTVVKEILNKYTEMSIRERIDDAMFDYVDIDTCNDEFDGDIYECYCETGRGEAENQVLTEIIAPYKITGEEEISVQYELCETWGIILTQ